MSKHGSVPIKLIICVGILSGCAIHTTPSLSPGKQAAYSVDNEVRGAKTSHLQLAEERRQEIEELVNEATAGPSIAVRSAAAWAAADQSTAPLADLLDAIDAARRAVLSNVRGADTTGFKATCCKVDGQTAACELDLTQGNLEDTSNALDLAIQGEGFFPIQLDPAHASQLAYTRFGTFYRNARNELILGLGDGYRLAQPITFPQDASNIAIGEDGTILCAIPGESEKRNIGQVRVAQFRNPTALTRDERSGLYLPNERSGPATFSSPEEQGAGTIEQGFLEASNVDLMRERLRLRFLNEWQNAIEQALANSGRSKSR